MPQTADYLWLGMAISALIMGLLVLSIITRARSLRSDLAMLDELERE
jgi:heme exporter protein D